MNEDYSDMPVLEDIVVFSRFILEREIFEETLYNYLESPFIPESFWEPVKIGLNNSEIESLKICFNETECLICTENNILKRELMCCKNIMCGECSNKWFLKSVKCPFCIQDIRTFLN
jgi:hypothetical protein